MNTDPELFSLITQGNLGENNLKLSVALLCAYNCLSDACEKQLWDLIKIIIRKESFFVDKRLHIVNPKKCYTVNNCGENLYFALDVWFQIKAIIKRNFRSIAEYSNRPSSYGLDDLPIRCKTDLRTIELSLVISTDGVPVKHGDFSVWPVWFSIADLPPILRFSYKNLILAGLWSGYEKPHWDFVFPFLYGELQNLKDIGFCVDGKHFVCKTALLVCDMVAKAPLLKMHQYNGYFGCPYCYEKGLYLQPMVYPTSNTITLRTCAEFVRDGIQAAVEGNPVNGLLGSSKLKNILNDVPFSLPFDPMHQVLSGVAKFLSLNIYRVLSKQFREKLKSMLQLVEYPSGITRPVTDLREVGKWKASQHKTFLFHLAPIMFLELIYGLPAGTNHQLINSVLNYCLFAFSIRFLSMRTVLIEDITRAQKLVDAFNESFLLCFTERQQRFNVHSIRHLPYQVQKFGPLWATSTFAFESAHHHLVKTFTGTVNHGKLIVERFAKLKLLTQEEIEDDSLQPFIENFFEKTKSDDFTKFTRVDNELSEFINCAGIGLVVKYAGRYKQKCGILWSKSYTRLPKR